MTIPSIGGSRATSNATAHTDPANVPLPPSVPSSRRSSVSNGSSLGLPKLAVSAKNPDAPQTRRGIGTLPAEMHIAIAAHLPLADLVSFSTVDKQIHGNVDTLIATRHADFHALSTRIDNAENLNDLHAIASGLPRDDLPLETVCAKVGLKMSRMISTINAPGTTSTLAVADRAAEVHRCLATYARMEPAAMRAAGLGRSIGLAKSVLPADHQAVFDDGVAKMKETVPGKERGPVLKALIAVSTTSDYNGTGPASEQVAANIAQVLENMDGLSVAVRTQLVMTAMTQTKELCEPGWSNAMSAVTTAYGALK